MRAGFTGTRRGTTPPQRAALLPVLAGLRSRGADCLVSGACEGADREADEDWWDLGGWVHHLPGDNWQGQWAITHRHDGDIVDDVSPYLKRNRRIVRSSSVMVAAPGEMLEVLRSGTWTTVRYARVQGLELILVLPTGEVRTEPAVAPRSCLRL